MLLTDHLGANTMFMSALLEHLIHYDFLSIILGIPQYVNIPIYYALCYMTQACTPYNFNCELTTS